MDMKRLPDRRRTLPLQEASKPTLVIGEESLCGTRPYYFRRCKRVKPTNIESLPSDLLSDILLLLPADYLHDRASLVCRRWYHIIRSDAFVNKQIQYSTYGLLVSCSVEEDSQQIIFMTATQGRVEISKLSYESTTRLLNGFNGLVLKSVYHRRSSLCIINPATKQSLSLPPLPPYVDEELCCIAYAPSSMKYKLIVPLQNRIHGQKLFILTVGVDSSWRHMEMDNVHPMHRVVFLQSALITEGFVHWASTYGSYVATMDVETEIVSSREIRTPRGSLGKHLLSSGRFLTMLVGYIDFLWEIREMKSETGEWRKVLPDIEFGGLLDEFVLRRGNEDLGDLLHGVVTPRGKFKALVPIGWVKYPDVLLFRFWKRCKTHILYNRETHEINSIEIPRRSRFENTTFVHKNNLAGVVQGSV